MIKTLTLDGLTSVKIKQSAYDMARFCWIKNLSEADVFASCVNAECTENADEVRRIPAGEFGMLDTESYETLYLNGSGAVEIVTTAFLVCPFNRGGKGGGSGGMTVDTLLDITITKGDASSGDYSSCSPAQNSIITLAGNMTDYKFVYILPTINNDLSLEYNAPKICYSSIFISGGTFIRLYTGSGGGTASLKYISPNQITISYSKNSYSVKYRFIVLGIK